MPNPPEQNTPSTPSKSAGQRLFDDLSGNDQGGAGGGEPAPDPTPVNVTGDGAGGGAGVEPAGQAPAPEPTPVNLTGGDAGGDGGGAQGGDAGGGDIGSPLEFGGDGTGDGGGAQDGDAGGEPASNPWLDSIRELGFQDVEDEEQARERVVQAIQHSRQRENQFTSYFEQIKPLVNYGRQYLELQKDPKYQQAFGQGQHAAPAGEGGDPAQQDDGDWWSPPPFDHTIAAQWRETKIDPETGEQFATWKDGTPAKVRSDAEAYQDYIRNWEHQLVYNPQEAIGRAIRHEFQKLYSEEQSKSTTEQTYHSALQQFQQQHADLLFERDPYTNQPTSRLSNDGLVIRRYIEEAETGGVGTQDPRMILDYAMLRYQRDMAARQQAQPAQPNGQPAANGQANGANGNGRTNGHAKPAPARNTQNGGARIPNPQNPPTGNQTQSQRQMNFLQRGAAQPHRGAGNMPNTMDAAPPERNPNLSPGNRLLEQIKQDQAAV